MTDFFKGGVKKLALAVLIGLAFGPARSAEAAAFRVNPIRVDFDRTSSSVLLTLSNDSPEELRFQISAFEWGMDPAGEILLKPTTDIRFFPALLTLGPGQQRNVRVGNGTAPGAVEKTYRIFFEELPGLQKAAEESAGAQVKIVTKIGVPIFVAPEQRKASGEITGLALQGKQISFAVQNTGNVSFVSQSVKVIGTDENNKTVFEKQREGWYVLSGTSRAYAVEMTAEECRATRLLRVEVQTDLSEKPETSLLKRDVAVQATQTCN